MDCVCYRVIGTVCNNSIIDQVNFYADTNKRLLLKRRMIDAGPYSGYKKNPSANGDWVYTYLDVAFKDGDVLYYSVLIYTLPYGILYEKQKEYFVKIKLLNGVPTIVANGTVHKRYLQSFNP